MMLVLTGLSLPLARFQARCAFTGCGYTTAESERIVTHPVRRKIVGALMLLGNVGIVTTIGTLMAGLLAGDTAFRPVQQPDGTTQLEAVAVGWPIWSRLLVLFMGIGLLWIIASSRFVDRAVNRWTIRLLRRYTDLEIRDYSNLMHLAGEYGINEMAVSPGDWFAGRSLTELRLTKEGVIILGIQRKDGTYLGAPTADTVLRPGDSLIAYGRTKRLAELNRRRADDRAQHVEAMVDERVHSLEETAEDSATDETKRQAAEEAMRIAEARRRTVREHAGQPVEDS